MTLGVRLVVPKQRVGVTLIGFDEAGRILMLKHVYHPSTPWGVPGGWLQKGESPGDCALRELKEETGLSAELGPVVHATREVSPEHIGIAYTAKIQPGEICLSSEILQAKWFTMENLPQPILPFVSDSINQASEVPLRVFMR